MEAPTVCPSPSLNQGSTQSIIMHSSVVVLAMLAAVTVAAPQLNQPQQRQQEPIAIVKLNSDISPDGSFTYEYETANQIKAAAQGTLKNAGNPEQETQSITGSFSFVADDGQTYTVTYVADENGFQPQGAHLPVPPPIPEEIARSIQYNEQHPEEDPENQPQQAAQRG